MQWKQVKLANMPVMVDFGGNTPPLSIEELFMKHLRPGDIYTHTYTLLEGNVRETVVDTATNKSKVIHLGCDKEGYRVRCRLWRCKF